jgi:DNA oxidative demethylase
MRGLPSEPEGLIYAEDFLGNAAEDALLAYVASLKYERVMMRGNIARRTVHHFGLRYDYGSKVLKEAEPIPPEFAPLINRAEDFSGLTSGSVVEALVNRYPPGAGVGWHSDAPMYRTIIGISLGSPCKIQFKTKEANEARVFEQPLSPRSIYVLRDQVRDEWQHRIPSTNGERYSLTFRSLRQE